MKKGLVMEIEKKVAYVLSDQGTFERIKARPGLKTGKTIYYFEEDLASISGGARWKTWMVYAAVLAMAVFFGARSGLFMTDGVCAVVSLDVNPSLQMYLDRDLQVVETVVLEGAGQISDEDTYQGLPVAEALTRALVEAGGESSDQGGGIVLVASASLDERVDGERLAESLAESVSKDAWIRESGLTVFVLRAESSDVPESEELRMSLGKFMVLRLNEGKNLDPEVLKAMDPGMIFEQDYLASVTPVVTGEDWWLAEEEFQEEILDQEQIPAGAPE